MAKEKNVYFTLLERQVQYCVRASELLSDIFNHYSEDKAPAWKEKMHQVEREGDELRHEIVTRLSREFITPIDQEDILRLVQILDDITDAIDETAMDLYMFHIERIPERAPAMAAAVSDCVKALAEAVSELHSFKRPQHLGDLIRRVNDLEGTADATYTEAIHCLFASAVSCKELIGGKAIYESLENCCDLCEHAADAIEQIVIKNT